MNLNICNARQDDLPILFQLNKSLIDAYEDIDSIDYEKVLKWVNVNLARNLCHFRRIMVDDHLAGFYCLFPSDTILELDSFFMFPDYQRTGVGTSVLTQILKSTNIPIYLYVFRKNQDAIRFYSRLGFSITQEIGTTRFIMTYHPL